MAILPDGKYDLWQMYYGKCNYDRRIVANETLPLWQYRVHHIHLAMDFNF